MNRIVFLPVDERFCTRDYFILLSKAAGLDISTPDRKLLGMKKVQPDMNVIHNWLDKNVKTGDYAVLSIDMLVHGGLIPSRMSLDSSDTLEKRLEILKVMKKKDARIYASVCVTRAPFYDSAEEEPDYWEYYGKRIYDYSRELVEKGINIHNDEFELPFTDIPAWIIEDFVARRRRNFKLIQKVIEYVKENRIDFLNLTLDDNSSGSISLFEASLHQKMVDEAGLNGKIMIHAGADESTLTLLSRLLCDLFDVRPKFEVDYVFPEYRDFIPAYEGRPLHESIKSQIESSGGFLCGDRGDILLAVNNPSSREEGMKQVEDDNLRKKYGVFVENCNVRCTVRGYANIRYTNGSDNYFVEKLLLSSPNWDTTNSSGWNTAGNTLGTVCAHSIIQFLIYCGKLKGDSTQLRKLQYIFLMEHWGFQSNVRKSLLEKAWEEKKSKPWSVMAIERWALEFTGDLLKPFSDTISNALKLDVDNFEIYFPWHRSFELAIKID